MDYNSEIIRRDKRIESYKKDILALKEEIIALKQLLDCAVANISLLVKEKGGSCKISRSDVSKALGKYRLQARCGGILGVFPTDTISCGLGLIFTLFSIPLANPNCTANSNNL